MWFDRPIAGNQVFAGSMQRAPAQVRDAYGLPFVILLLVTEKAS